MGTMGILAKLAFNYGITPETLITLRLVISFGTLAVFLGLFDWHVLRAHLLSAQNLSRENRCF